jgi:hypothetical protein
MPLLVPRDKDGRFNPKLFNALLKEATLEGLKQYKAIAEEDLKRADRLRGLAIWVLKKVESERSRRYRVKRKQVEQEKEGSDGTATNK